jgi:putative ABC transport system permease protein
VKIRENSEIINKVFSTGFFNHSMYRIVAVKRHTTTIIPNGNDQILANDLVYFICSKDNLEYVRKAAGKTNFDIKDIIIMGGSKIALKTVQYLPNDINVKIIENDREKCYKLADKTDTKVGETVKVSWTEGSRVVEYEVVVTAIVDNYAFHYVYMTPYYYSTVTRANLSYNYLFCKIADDITVEQKAHIEKTVNDIKGVNGSVFTTVVIDNFNNIVDTLNLVILLFIVAAMGLAMVVLYNLNNINVNERIRELATLKVLGFYNNEVSAYIYRENIFLTLIGMLVGIVLGIPLNIIVVGIVDIDTLTFSTELQPLSFVFAIALTL